MKSLLVLVLIFSTSAVFAESIYRLETKIGEKVYDDILVLDAGLSATDIKGSLTVPGVFSSRLTNIKVVMRWSGAKYNFQVNAEENGEAYAVFYELYENYQAGSLPTITGTLMKDGLVIGQIEGKKIY